MRVLVTGGAGFIGSHVVDRLLDDGHAVEVVDNLATGRRERVPEAVRLHVCDLRDERLGAVVDAARPEIIVHVAAQAAVPRSVADPRLGRRTLPRNTNVQLRLFRRRSDVGERGEDPFGPAGVAQLQAHLDAAGRVVGWQHELWSPGHSSRPGRA